MNCNLDSLVQREKERKLREYLTDRENAVFNMSKTQFINKMLYKYSPYENTNEKLVRNIFHLGNNNVSPIPRDTNKPALFPQKIVEPSGRAVVPLKPNLQEKFSELPPLSKQHPIVQSTPNLQKGGLFDSQLTSHFVSPPEFGTKSVLKYYQSLDENIVSL